jgi:hypothetical protein
MPERLPQLTARALLDSARDRGENVTGPAGQEIARTRAALAAGLASGRLVATVVSSLTGDEISISVKCKAKIGGRWQLAPYAEADAVYIDVPRGGDSGAPDYSIGTLYPPHHPNKAGLFFYATNVDRSRVEAAKHVLLSAIGQAQRDDEILPAKACMRCGQLLRRRDSIVSRYGPECIGKVEAYLNAHQKPGEQFFADVAPDGSPAEADDNAPPPAADELGTGDWHEIERERRERRQALGGPGAQPSRPEPSRAAPSAPEGLVLLPAGADPRDILRELT